MQITVYDPFCMKVFREQLRISRGVKIYQKPERPRKWKTNPLVDGLDIAIPCQQAVFVERIHMMPDTTVLHPRHDNADCIWDRIFRDSKE